MATTNHQLWSIGLVNTAEEGAWQPKDRNSRQRSSDILWKGYLDDPLQGWDNCNSRGGPAYPDFKNKIQDGGLYEKSVKLVHEKARGYHKEGTALVALLRACAKNKDLDRGTRVHDEISKKGLLENCSDALVSMYARCGELNKAHELLDMYKSRNVSSWTALISGYARHGQGQNALNCFEQMQREGLSPDAMTFASILKACGSLKAIQRGEHIHDEIARQGLLGNDIVLGKALVHMYVKCGAPAKAHRVLEELRFQDVVSWSALVAGYAQRDQGQEALHCFEQMQRKGLSPDATTLSYILKVCGSIKAYDKGKRIHDEISRQGLLGNHVVLGNALVDMYVKCGFLEKARRVHAELPCRDVVSWNSLIAGCTQQGQGEQALEYFEGMQHEGLCPNAITFSCILKACGSIGAADKGEQIHDMIARQGLLGNSIVLGTALVDMYAKCGALAKAQKVLEELPFRDVVSWSALIAGYTKYGQGEQALKCFEQMQHEGLSPDCVTFSCILKACGSIGAADRGEQIHDEIARKGLLGKNIVLDNALVDMYVKCGALEKAQQVLEKLPSRDVVTWTTLIGGYAQQGQGEEALNCLEQMQREGLSPNAVTFACILKACGTIGAADKGEQIHDEIARQGLLGNNIVLGTALVDMYAKCGALMKAQKILEELPSRDVAPWNALITGYAQQGQGKQALDCFKAMQHEGVPPDAVTFSCVLNACSHLGLVEDGHMYFVSMSRKEGITPDLEHYTCMIDLFGRAGHLNKAVGVIQEMRCTNDSAVWYTLLSACQKWGDVSVGRWAFEQAVQLDKSDSAAYVLMANIYVAAGMQEDASLIEALRMENRAWRKLEARSLLVG